MGDGQVVGALGNMPHKMAFDGGKAGLREHLLLRLPGWMHRPPAHLAILVVNPGPEEWLARFFQTIRIGKVQVQQYSWPL